MAIEASRLNTQSVAARVASRDDVLDFLAVHDIDILRWVGGEVRSVFAMADQFVYANDGVETIRPAFISFRLGRPGSCAGVLGSAG
jgi:predicted dehydrogenase